jgi:hypothetical protein
MRKKIAFILIGFFFISLGSVCVLGLGNAEGSKNLLKDGTTAQRKSQPKLPDLIIRGIRLIEDCKIEIVITNKGNLGVPDSAYHSTQGASIQMFKDGTPWGGARLSVVDPSRGLKHPGASIGHVWFPESEDLKLDPGPHYIKVTVDENNVVEELDETNNARTVRLTCESAAKKNSDT